ncbi:PTS sugar transporter subunit IIA [Paenibacillus sp. 8b26]|uniref:PTS sugar transporter subunit IIA n=1 Tax=Paenibacillus sp. 8b26 TaxID=3424133 RepID=UPI003D661D40
MFGFKNKKTPKEVLIASPLIGKVLAIEEVDDDAFSSKALGEGIAIIPSEGKIMAPFDGTLAHIMEKSKHALLLEDESGIQILIHVGINTVSLKGNGFASHVASGEKVKKGQLLLEFDIEQIQKAGCSVITPIVIPNGQDSIKNVEILQNPGEDSRLERDLIRVLV